MMCKVLAIGILLFLFQLSFVICGIWEPSNSRKEIVCTSPECLKRGNFYFENLSPTVNPCDDFYTFVCGAWYVQHRSPPHIEEWTIHDVLEQQLIHDFREILENPVSSPEPELMQLKYFYNICTKQPFYGRHSPTEVARQIVKAGRYGKKSIWDIHESYLKLTGESAFFNHAIYALNPKGLVPVLIVREVTSPYGAIYHREWKPEEEKNYEHFLYALMTSLKLRGTNIYFRDKIKAVIKFRHQLNEIMSESRKRSIMKTEAMSAREFQQWFRGLSVGRVKRSGMPWEKIIKTILSVIPKVKQDTQITRIQDEGYFKDLDELLSSVSQEVLDDPAASSSGHVDHMEMYFAERHTVLTGVMEDFIERTVIQPTNLTDYIREDTPKWKACIENLSMWPEIGKVLQEKWFRKDVTHSMNELVNDVKFAIKSEVKNSSWLNAPTKEETIKRVLGVRPWIGFPPSFEGAFDDPMRVEAHMDVDKHVLFIKSPMLQPPFFDPSLPNIYNYGAIGYIVGHELYHVIHDCGKYVSADNFAIRWWPKEMRNRCHIQMKCFMDAYNKQTQREFQLKYHETLKMANRLSYLEDFPDVMGLDAAFRAYQIMKKQDKSACQTLPRFEKYSCEQMFFISFANTMCGKVTSKTAAKHHIETSKHSIDPVRVNGAVQNNEFFHKAFQCPRGKPMNPPVKCNLWK